MAFIKASVDLTVDLLKWLNSLKLISAAAVKKKMVLKKKRCPGDHLQFVCFL